LVQEDKNAGIIGNGTDRVCSVCAWDPECISWNLGQGDYDKLASLVSHPPVLEEGKHLFQAGDDLTAVYAVRTGAFKTYAFNSDGQEYVLGFAFPGELVGFDGVYSRRHGCNAMAVEDSSVCALPYFNLASLMEASAMLREQILRLASQGFGNGIVNARLTPEARLANFLLDMHKRRGNGDASDALYLQMSTCDLANYLRVSVVEIEGLFAYYKQEKVIDKDGSRLELLDLDSLREATLQKIAK